MNFFGIADVADLLDRPNKKPFPETWPYTVQWLGNQPNRADVARAASPLAHVRPGVPPTISIHGDADPLVPYPVASSSRSLILPQRDRRIDAHRAADRHSLCDERDEEQYRGDAGERRGIGGADAVQRALEET